MCGLIIKQNIFIISVLLLTACNNKQVVKTVEISKLKK